MERSMAERHLELWITLWWGATCTAVKQVDEQLSRWRTGDGGALVVMRTDGPWLPETFSRRLQKCGPSLRSRFRVRPRWEGEQWRDRVE